MAKGKKTKNKNASTSKKQHKSHHQSHENEQKDIKSSGKKKQKRKDRMVNKISADDDFRKFVEQNDSRVINEMAEDGNCLFRSLSDQLCSDYGSKHDKIRSKVCLYLEENEESFQGFIVLEEEDDMDIDFEDCATSYTEYIDRMKQEGEWGGNAELVAAAQLFRRNITIFSAGGVFSIESGHDRNTGPDLMLSYHENSHYNSVKSSTPSDNEKPSDSTYDSKTKGNRSSNENNDDKDKKKSKQAKKNETKKE